MPFPLSKICTTCKIEKNSDCFYLRKNADGTKKLQGQCKNCLQSIKKKARELKKEEFNLKAKNRKKKCLDCENLIKRQSRTLRCRSCANKARWKNLTDEQKQTSINKLSACFLDPEHKKKLSDSMRIRRNTDEFKKKLISSTRNGRLSKLHKKINNFLDLPNKGFVSEQIVGKYFVDEINIDKKIIIEINGDYIHANPKFYKSEDTIKLCGKKYLAKEKWNYDFDRIEFLKKQGYTVVVIWETDDLEQHRQSLHTLLSKEPNG